MPLPDRHCLRQAMTCGFFCLVERSSGFARLDEAAMSAVRKTRFKPYTENGKAVAGWVRMPFPFELEK